MTQDKSAFSHWFEIGLVAILMVIYAYAALSEAHNFATQWFIRDDAFYYFKVAQNITEGYGVTFDGINPTNGYHPLWMLVCIPIFALARFDLILPLRVLILVSGAISAATGILLFRLVGRTLSLPAAVLAACYWCFDRAIHYNVTMFGLETGLTALTMTALLLALADIGRVSQQKPLSSRQLWSIGLLAVALVFSRLDTVFLAALAGAWIILRGTSLRVYLMLDVATIVSAAFISIAVRTGLPEYFAYTKSAIFLAGIGLITQIPLYYVFGLYHSSATKDKSSEALLLGKSKAILRFIAATLAGITITSAAMLGLLSAGLLTGLPRTALLLYAGIVFLGSGALRLAAGCVAMPRPALAIPWKRWISEGLHFYGILGVALMAYMGVNKIMFGTFTPVSGQIKTWWGSLQGSAYGNPISTLSGFLGLEREEGLNAWGPIVYWLQDLKNLLGGELWLALVLMVVAIFLILFTRPLRAARAGISLGLPILLSGSLLQMFYYNGLGYAGAKDWYWISQMLMFALLGALVFDLILRPLRKFRVGRLTAWTLTAALCLGFYALPFAVTVIQRMPWGAERAGQPYMDVLPFLESNTEEGALIGMTGGGNIGYFIQGRTIINMDGLINSFPYSQALRAGRADEYLAGIGLDYIFSNPDILQNPPYNSQFDEWSDTVAVFGRKNLSRYRQE